jgi:hypothetical protein
MYSRAVFGKAIEIKKNDRGPSRMRRSFKDAAHRHLNIRDADEDEENALIIYCSQIRWV